MGVLSKPSHQARSFFFHWFSSKNTAIPTVATVVILIALFNYRNKKLKQQLIKKSEISLVTIKERRKKAQGRVDLEFLQNFIKLLKIAIPKLTSRLTMEMLLMMTSLVARTFLSIHIASVNGALVRSVIERNLKSFMLKILRMCIIALPASFLNSYIGYLNHSIAFQVRQNLTTHFHGLYINNIKYYQVVNIDARIENPDQRLTNDIERFSAAFANLYSNVTKPVLDCILFGKSLGDKVGYGTVSLTFIWYLISGMFLKLISPPMGILTSMQQNYEGEFRSEHSSIKTFSQEIAFLNGAKWEKQSLKNKFLMLYNNNKDILTKRLYLGVFDSLMVRYGATLVGYFVLASPSFANFKGAKKSMTDLTGDYIRNGSLMINLAKSIGRIVVSYKDMQNIAGYTVLLHEIKVVLEDLNKDKYVRTQLSHKEGAKTNYRKTTSAIDIKNRGKMVVSDNDIIEFTNVPLVTPNGDVLVESVTFRLDKKDNLIISGPNGCGKSSLFRILGGLWPLLGGRVERPKLEDLFYLPQRPYLSEGTLKEQVIYPRYIGIEDISDDSIYYWLRFVDLGDLLLKPSALEEVRDWEEVLSGGEKQRIAMARLLFHKPKFAILDECTSTVSNDMETKFYTECRRLGISLFTISHRQSLFKYHDYYLKFDGEGSYEYINLRSLEKEPEMERYSDDEVA